jgi:hexosaminidase
MRDLHLLPTPRALEPLGQPLATARLTGIALRGGDPSLGAVAERLQRAVLDEHGVRWRLRAAPMDDEPALTLALGAPDAPDHTQGYRLTIDASGVVVSAADAAGLFYGCQTLRQLMRQRPDHLPGCVVEDHPDLPARGVMLDISRDKVPNDETLYRLVDQLAEWKINQLELYTEHTFAYRRHREVWAQASPMTPDDVLRLDRHCRDRYIELVPNQNSFGHLHRWLELPAYRHLAEAPEGWVGPDGTWRPVPFSLNPTDPASLRLLDGLYGELLPHFTSLEFNVGCDETWDLGQGASKQACERIGKGRVYLEFLLAIHRLVSAHGRRMRFWGDIIIEHPELVPELPQDVTVLEWGYEADHPFAEHAATFASSKLPFYVCPGTSSWNSIGGRTENCLANIDGAVRHGLATARPAASSPTGATTGTGSTRRRATSASRPARRCRGATSATETSISPRCSTFTCCAIVPGSAAACSSGWARCTSISGGRCTTRPSCSAPCGRDPTRPSSSTASTAELLDPHEGVRDDAFAEHDHARRPPR